MIPPLRTQPTDWKASATRIVGYMSLILGACCAFAFVILAQELMAISFTNPRTVFSTVLIFLLAANLLYLGFHAIARRTLPVHPQLPFRWRDVVAVRTAVASMNSTTALVCVIGIFAGCAAIGAHIAVSYGNWVNAVYTGKISGFELTLELHGRSMETLVKTEWLIWVLQFPVSMTVSIIAAMTLGIIRRRPLRNVGFAVASLFLGVFAAVVVSIYLLTFGIFLLIVPAIGLILSFVPYLACAVIFFSLSRAALLWGPETEGRPSLPTHWTAHFLRTILLVGLPAGLIVGISLATLLHNSDWTIPGIQIAWAALYGASLVYADRAQ